MKGMHCQLNILTLNVRRKHHVCHQVYSGINNLAPPYVCAKLQKVEHKGSIQTRSVIQDLLNIPKHRLELSRKNFYIKGPKVWNPLEKEIKNSDNLDIFKRNLYSSTTFTM